MPGNVCVAMGRSKLPVILRDGGPMFATERPFHYGEIGGARAGSDVTLMAMGTLAGAAVRAADALVEEGIQVAVDIVACPLQLDDSAMRRAAHTGLIVTVEDHSVASGLGASVAEWLAESDAQCKLVRLGVRDYQSSGAANDLFARAKLDAEGIVGALRDLRL
jgi:transketolase